MFDEAQARRGKKSQVEKQLLAHVPGQKCLNQKIALKYKRPAKEIFIRREGGFTSGWMAFLPRSHAA